MNEQNILEENLPNSKAKIKTYLNGTHKIKKVVLPELSDHMLLERYERIKPIILFNGLYFYIREYMKDDLKNKPYLDKPFYNIRKSAQIKNSQVLTEFICYHTQGAYGLFKPTIGEILSQIPDEVLYEGNAFFMSKRPEDLPITKLTKQLKQLKCYESQIQVLKLK